MASSDYHAKYHRISEPSPGVCLLAFNRPPVNAFNDDKWMEMRRLVEQISFDSKFRVIILASALEKFFTAGLDLQDAQGGLIGGDSLDPARQALKLHKHLKVFPSHLYMSLIDQEDFQDAITSLAHCRLPVIVALHGACLGLAIDISSACDVRLAASNATFAIAEVNVGLAADIGTLQRFPKIVGNESKARELALTGRKFSAAEARDIGFVSDIVSGGRKEVLDAALILAKSIAEKSPVAVVSTKHLMNHARDHSVQEGLDYTAAWNMSMLQSADTPTAIKAVMSKQTPRFQPLDGSSPSKAKL